MRLDRYHDVGRDVLASCRRADIGASKLGTCDSTALVHTAPYREAKLCTADSAVAASGSIEL